VLFHSLRNSLYRHVILLLSREEQGLERKYSDRCGDLWKDRTCYLYFIYTPVLSISLVLVR